MKSTTLTLIVLMMLDFITAYTQDKTKLIREIRKEFKDINSDSTLKKVTLENEKFLDHAADGGGELTGFYKNGQLKKIVSWVGLSNGNEIVEFYFKDSKLIFIYEQFNSFVYDEKKEILRFDTTEKTFDGRYYFYNNKLIDKVTTGHNRFEDENNDIEKTFLTEANNNMKLLENKKKNK